MRHLDRLECLELYCVELQPAVGYDGDLGYGLALPPENHHPAVVRLTSELLGNHAFDLLRLRSRHRKVRRHHGNAI